MVEIDKIRQLIAMMVENDLVEVTLKDGGEEVCLRRPSAATQNQSNPFSGMPGESGASSSAAINGAEGLAELSSAEAAEAKVDLVPIVSPMVGTFYRAQDPEAPPFVEVGTVVQPGKIVCILEAMKVFNEIKSEVSGIIEKILATNEQAVEYGEALFLVRPA